MVSGNHSIGRINLRLTFGSENQAKSLSDKYLLVLKQQALPALEALLDQYDQPGYILKIDKLQLDLGDFRGRAPEQTLVERLITQMEQQLVGLTANTSSSWTEKAQKVPVAVSKLEAFKTFLITGTLPSMVESMEFSKEIQSLWEASSVDFFAMLIKAFRQKGQVALQRLSYQLPEKLLVKLVHYSLNNKIAAECLSVQQKLKAVPEPHHRVCTRTFWPCLLEICLDPPSDEQQLVEQLLLRIKKQTKNDSQVLNVFKKQIPESWQPILKEMDSVVESEEPILEESVFEPDALYCSNAGVVMLLPFLKSYFAACNLLDTSGKSFLTEDMQFKAIYLLHYLATGLWLTPEINLVLPKIICGIPIDQPIPQDFELEEIERKESQSVLAAVLKHWGKLPNTSTEGLRKGFLQREGKLQSQRNNWVLKVEHKTLDILLDSLPWSFSRFKLPWMKKYIRVEWTG